MNNETNRPIRELVEEIYRNDAPRVLATLIRLLGDFDLAEDAMQDAFSAALRQWGESAVPANPRAWLIAAGRFKGIDSIRRGSRSNALSAEWIESRESETSKSLDVDEEGIEDDCLRLIFTCCHPALSVEAQVALTLREVCGLTTEEIARAFLASPTALAQRIVRAKSKIREGKIPYEVPGEADLPNRLANVLRVIYLVFNEGYYASSGEALTRQVLSSEAIRLGRLVAELLPEPETLGLLALMLLQESRRNARVSQSGDLILLSEQDRSLWDETLVSEGLELVQRAYSKGDPANYAIQAAISAVHVESTSVEGTHWDRVVGLYDMLLLINPSSIVALNRAVAVAMRDGEVAGLAIIDELLLAGTLQDYGLAHSARADLCRRLGRYVEAKESYCRALKLAHQEPERRFLKRRIDEVTTISE